MTGSRLAGRTGRMALLAFTSAFALLHRPASALAQAAMLGVPAGADIRVESPLRGVGKVRGTALALGRDSLRLRPLAPARVTAIGLVTGTKVFVRDTITRGNLTRSAWVPAVVPWTRIRVTDAAPGSVQRVGVVRQITPTDLTITPDSTVSEVAISLATNPRIELSEGVKDGEASTKAVVIGATIGALVGWAVYRPPCSEKTLVRICPNRLVSVMGWGLVGGVGARRIGGSVNAAERWVPVVARPAPPPLPPG